MMHSSKYVDNRCVGEVEEAEQKDENEIDREGGTEKAVRFH